MADVMSQRFAGAAKLALGPGKVGDGLAFADQRVAGQQDVPRYFMQLIGELLVIYEVCGKGEANTLLNNAGARPKTIIVPITPMDAITPQDEV